MKHAIEPEVKPRAQKLPAIHWKTLLADDVRLEADMKVSVLGLYADDKIHVNMPADAKDPSRAEPIGIEGVCILSTVFNLATPTVFQMNLCDPAGHVVANGSVAIQPGAVHNSISKFRPLPITGFGAWKLEFKSDSHHFEYFFDVLRAPILGAPLPVETVQKASKKRIKS